MQVYVPDLYDEAALHNLMSVVTAPEAQGIYYIHARAIRNAAQKGKLHARWAGATWLIDRHSLYQLWAANYREPDEYEMESADIHAVLVSGEVTAMYGVAWRTMNLAWEASKLMVRKSANQWLIDAACAERRWAHRRVMR